MRLLTVSLLLIAPAASLAQPLVPPLKGKSEKIDLFNGKDIDDWGGNKKLWSVKEGAIVGHNEGEVRVSTYLLTKRKFSDFHLTFSAKLSQSSEMHSGIAFWGAVAPNRGDPWTYKGHLVMFPSGWGLYDLYGRAGLKVDNKPVLKVSKQHDWNDIEIFAQGNRIRVVANGVLVVDWRDAEPDRIEEGPIGLQLHSNRAPQEVQFKGLVLESFPDDKRLTNKKVGDKIDSQ